MACGGSAVVSALVGMVGGAASRATSPGLPLTKSIVVVASTGIIAMVALRPRLFSEMFLLAPLGGILLGGVLAAIAGALGNGDPQT